MIQGTYGTRHRGRGWHLRGRVRLALVTGLAIIVFTRSGLAADAARPPATGAELFQPTKVWTIHLTFTPEQWAAMEPKGGAKSIGLFGGGFGAGMFFGPALLGAADGDDDGKISKSEFHALAERWFAEWDKPGAGRLDAAQIRAGLTAALAPPEAGRGAFGAANFLRGPEGQRNGLASALGIEFTYARAALEFEGRPLADVAVRYKGNGTWLASQASLKRSLKVDLNRFADGQTLAGQAKLNLHNNVTDAGWMNEVLSHRLYRDAGVPAPRTAYARVYVTAPGKHDERTYLGLYSIVEEVGKSFAADRFGTPDGAVFKPVVASLFADLGDNWARYRQAYDPKTDVTERQTRRVIDFARLVTRAADDEFANRLGDFLDLDEFSRYMAVTVWLCSLDSILTTGQNFYLYLDPRTERFAFIPWDLDHSFGNADFLGSQEQRERLDIHRPWVGENRFLSRVFKVEAFKKRYLARLEEFNTGVCAPDRIKQLVDEHAAAIRPAIADESPDKLERFEQTVAGRPTNAATPGGGLGGLMTAFFRKPPKPIVTFAPARAASVADQLAGRAKGLAAPGFGFAPAGDNNAANDRFSPGALLGPGFMSALDADKDKAVTRDEFLAGFDRWFDAWDADQAGLLTEQQLRAALDKAFPFSWFGGGRGK